MKNECVRTRTGHRSQDQKEHRPVRDAHSNLIKFRVNVDMLSNNNK